MKEFKILRKKIDKHILASIPIDYSLVFRTTPKGEEYVIQIFMGQNYFHEFCVERIDKVSIFFIENKIREFIPKFLKIYYEKLDKSLE